MSSTPSGACSIPRSSRRARARYRDGAVGRRARPLHGRVHADGAVRVVSRSTCVAADRPRRRRPSTSRASRSAPARTGSSATRSTIGSSSRRSTTTSAAGPRNDGLVLKIVPDDIMRGLELRKGTMDIVVNDLSPDIVHQLEARSSGCRSSKSPGIDYQYIGFNLRDPLLQDCASGRRSPTRSIAGASSSTCAAVWPRPPSGCCRRRRGRSSRRASRSRTIRRGRSALLDEAGYPDPDGDGPQPRLQLSLKMSNIEFNRLQSLGDPAGPPRRSASRSTSAPTSSRRCTRTSSRATSSCSRCSGPAARSPIPTSCAGSSTRSQVPPVGLQPRPLQQSARRSRCSTRRRRRPTRRAARALRGGPADRRRGRALHQPLVQDERRVASSDLTGIHILPMADFMFLKDVAHALP